jgi:hypothetical protein
VGRPSGAGPIASEASRLAVGRTADRTAPRAYGYFVSVFQMSWMAFHLPSAPFRHTVTYFPLPTTVLPSEPLNESC